MTQHHLTRIHHMRFKLTLNLSKSDGQVRPFCWKRNYNEPSTTNSCLKNGAEEAISEFMKSRERKSTLESNRRKANDNLNQVTMQLCNTITQCNTLKVGENKIVIIPNDNRVTLIKSGAGWAIIKANHTCKLTMLILTYFVVCLQNRSMQQFKCWT
jgi:hypothetical protein